MNEKDKYNEMINKLKEKYSNYNENDNTIKIVKETWSVNDRVICINNNFMVKKPSHGKKDGLTFGKVYKIVELPEIDMIKIENDDGETVPYYVWRFYKIKTHFLN